MVSSIESLMVAVTDLGGGYKTSLKPTHCPKVQIIFPCLVLLSTKSIHGIFVGGIVWFFERSNFNVIGYRAFGSVGLFSRELGSFGLDSVDGRMVRFGVDLFAAGGGARHGVYVSIQYRQNREQR